MNGRDLRSGGLRTATVNAREVHEALTQTVGQIIDAVRETLEETPPELSADISEHGIVLAGGGVLLRDFPQRLRAETGLPVRLVAEPLTCVAVGAGRCLDGSRCDRLGGEARRAASHPDLAGSVFVAPLNHSFHALHRTQGQPNNRQSSR